MKKPNKCYACYGTCYYDCTHKWYVGLGLIIGKSVYQNIC
jgi:hypothetical protein